MDGFSFQLPGITYLLNILLATGYVRTSNAANIPEIIKGKSPVRKIAVISARIYVTRKNIKIIKESRYVFPGQQFRTKILCVPQWKVLSQLEPAEVSGFPVTSTETFFMPS